MGYSAGAGGPTITVPTERMAELHAFLVKGALEAWGEDCRLSWNDDIRPMHPFAIYSNYGFEVQLNDKLTEAGDIDSFDVLGFEYSKLGSDLDLMLDGLSLFGTWEGDTVTWHWQGEDDSQWFTEFRRAAEASEDGAVVVRMATWVRAVEIIRDAACGAIEFDSEGAPRCGYCMETAATRHAILHHPKCLQVQAFEITRLEDDQPPGGWGDLEEPKVLQDVPEVAPS